MLAQRGEIASGSDAPEQHHTLQRMSLLPLPPRRAAAPGGMPPPPRARQIKVESRTRALSARSRGPTGESGRQAASR